MLIIARRPVLGKARVFGNPLDGILITAPDGSVQLYRELTSPYPLPDGVPSELKAYCNESQHAYYVDANEFQRLNQECRNFMSQHLGMRWAQAKDGSLMWGRVLHSFTSLAYKVFKVHLDVTDEVIGCDADEVRRGVQLATTHSRVAESGDEPSQAPILGKRTGSRKKMAESRSKQPKLQQPQLECEDAVAGDDDDDDDDAADRTYRASSGQQKCSKVVVGQGGPRRSARLLPQVNTNTPPPSTAAEMEEPSNAPQPLPLAAAEMEERSNAPQPLPPSAAAEMEERSNAPQPLPPSAAAEMEERSNAPQPLPPSAAAEMEEHSNAPQPLPPSAAAEMEERSNAPQPLPPSAAAEMEERSNAPQPLPPSAAEMEERSNAPPPLPPTAAEMKERSNAPPPLPPTAAEMKEPSNAPPPLPPTAAEMEEPSNAPQPLPPTAVEMEKTRAPPSLPPTSSEPCLSPPWPRGSMPSSSQMLFAAEQQQIEDVSSATAEPSVRPVEQTKTRDLNMRGVWMMDDDFGQEEQQPAISQAAAQWQQVSHVLLKQQQRIALQRKLRMQTLTANLSTLNNEVSTILSRSRRQQHSSHDNFKQLKMICAAKEVVEAELEELRREAVGNMPFWPHCGAAAAATTSAAASSQQQQAQAPFLPSSGSIASSQQAQAAFMSTGFVFNPQQQAQSPFLPSSGSIANSQHAQAHFLPTGFVLNPQQQAQSPFLPSGFVLNPQQQAQAPFLSNGFVLNPQQQAQAPFLPSGFVLNPQQQAQAPFLPNGFVLNPQQQAQAAFLPTGVALNPQQQAKSPFLSSGSTASSQQAQAAFLPTGVVLNPQQQAKAPFLSSGSIASPQLAAQAASLLAAGALPTKATPSPQQAQTAAAALPTTIVATKAMPSPQQQVPVAAAAASASSNAPPPTDGAMSSSPLAQEVAVTNDLLRQLVHRVNAPGGGGTGNEYDPSFENLGGRKSIAKECAFFRSNLCSNTDITRNTQYLPIITLQTLWQECSSVDSANTSASCYTVCNSCRTKCAQGYMPLRGADPCVVCTYSSALRTKAQCGRCKGNMADFLGTQTTGSNFIQDTILVPISKKYPEYSITMRQEAPFHMVEGVDHPMDSRSAKPSKKRYRIDVFVQARNQAMFVNVIVEIINTHAMDQNGLKARMDYLVTEAKNRANYKSVLMVIYRDSKCEYENLLLVVAMRMWILACILDAKWLPGANAVRLMVFSKSREVEKSDLFKGAIHLWPNCVPKDPDHEWKYNISFKDRYVLEKYFGKRRLMDTPVESVFNGTYKRPTEPLAFI